MDFTEFVTAFADIPNFASMMAGDSAPEPGGARAFTSTTGAGYEGTATLAAESASSAWLHRGCVGTQTQHYCGHVSCGL